MVFVFKDPFNKNCLFCEVNNKINTWSTLSYSTCQAKSSELALLALVEWVDIISRMNMSEDSNKKQASVMLQIFL